MIKLRNIWEKNWPEIHAGMTGGLPGFIFSANPALLGNNVPVFCYHLVEAERFKGDLVFLRHNGYTTLGADDLLDHITGKTPAPENSIVLTFDDGSRNLYDIAYPLLQEFEMHAVVFIAPGLHPDDKDEGLPTRPLDWGTIREMQDSGCFDFQSHTLEHRYIPRWPEWIELAGADQQVIKQRLVGPLPMEEDLTRAKLMIQKKLGKPVKHLAFPKFFGTDNAILMGKHIGYEGFWWGSLPGRPGNTSESDPAHIVRLEGQFIRRLPGDDRETLRTVLGRRYLGSLQRYTGHRHGEAA